MSADLPTPRAPADPRFRGMITTVLLIMLAAMLVRDILTRRRKPLREGSRRDISFAVR